MTMAGSTGEGASISSCHELLCPLHGCCGPLIVVSFFPNDLQGRLWQCAHSPCCGGVHAIHSDRVLPLYIWSSSHSRPVGGCGRHASRTAISLSYIHRTREFERVQALVALAVCLELRYGWPYCEQSGSRHTTTEHVHSSHICMAYGTSAGQPCLRSRTRIYRNMGSL